MPSDTQPETVVAGALRGPWLAVLADEHGFVYDSFDDAVENAEDPDAEVTVSVVRGTAAPNDRNGTTGCRLRLPGSYHSGDVAYVLDDICLEDPDDPTVGAGTRFEQAKAMAVGLNDTQGAALADANEQLGQALVEARANLRDAQADIQSQASRLADLYDTVRGCAEALRGALAETDPDAWNLAEAAADVADDLDRIVSE